MARAPDPGYRFWSDHSRRTVTLDEMLEELRRELAYRRDHYPALIAKGRLTELDCSAEIAMVEALVDEFAWAVAIAGDGRTRPFPERRFTYWEKIACLRREIEIRRNYYPRLLASRRMRPEAAQRHLSAIEAAHAWYWYRGLQFIEGERYFRWTNGPGGACANIRAEFARREAWAIDHGYDISGAGYCAGIYEADWSAVPKLAQEAAE